MGCKLHDVIKHLSQKGIFIVALSLDGCSTKSKEAQSLHEVKVTQLEANPLFLSPGDNQQCLIHLKGCLVRLIRLFFPCVKIKKNFLDTNPEFQDK